MTERYVCVFFFGDFNVTTPPRRSSTHSLSQSHTHTRTLTHMTGQQWLGGQVVPDFSGFANIFDHKEGRKKFLTDRGSRNIRKYFQSAINVFSCLCMYYFLMQALCCNKITLGKLLICKAQLLEINRAPTAG